MIPSTTSTSASFVALKTDLDRKHVAYDAKLFDGMMIDVMPADFGALVHGRWIEEIENKGFQDFLELDREESRLTCKHLPPDPNWPDHADDEDRGHDDERARPVRAEGLGLAERPIYHDRKLLYGLTVDEVHDEVVRARHSFGWIHGCWCSLPRFGGNTRSADRTVDGLSIPRNFRKSVASIFG